VSLVLLSAGEIPRELASGRIHLGVTGTDLVQEKLALWQTSVTALAELGFGHADLILAVPQGWSDVDTLHDLDAAARRFGRSTVTACGSPRNITGWCASFCARRGWLTTRS